jgi:photosystem II stability/assembly factor-like uncharacterized protein
MEIPLRRCYVIYISVTITMVGLLVHGGVGLRTTDGGDSWSKQYLPTEELVDVFCLDSLHIFSVGTDHGILETMNSGVSWIHRDSTTLPGGTIRNMYFINTDTGMFVQSEGLFRTIDKGETWQSQLFDDLWDITGYGEKDCWGAGYHGKIFYSSDAGATWTNQYSGVDAWLKDIKFVNSNVGWAVGEGSVLKPPMEGIIGRLYIQRHR